MQGVDLWGTQRCTSCNWPWSEGQGRAGSGQLPGEGPRWRKQTGREGWGPPQLLPLFHPGSSWKPDSQGAEKWSASWLQQDSKWGRDKQSTQLREGSSRAFVKAMPVYSSLNWAQEGLSDHTGRVCEFLLLRELKFRCCSDPWGLWLVREVSTQAHMPRHPLPGVVGPECPETFSSISVAGRLGCGLPSTCLLWMPPASLSCPLASVGGFLPTSMPGTHLCPGPGWVGQYREKQSVQAGGGSTQCSEPTGQ